MNWKDYLTSADHGRLAHLDALTDQIATEKAALYVAAYQRYLGTIEGQIFTTGRGDFFIVSPEDAERVSRYKWQSVANKQGEDFRLPYVAATIEGKRQYLHRFLMGSPDGMVVDHIDSNPLNNTRTNLRVVTQRNNARFSTNHRKNGGLPGSRLQAAVSTSGVNRPCK